MEGIGTKMEKVMQNGFQEMKISILIWMVKSGKNIIMMRPNKLNVIRIIIAGVIIYGSISDFVCSYYDETIVSIAQCDKMGYGGLISFRLAKVSSLVLSVLYLGLVLMYVYEWKGKRCSYMIAAIDCIVITIWLYNMFELG